MLRCLNHLWQSKLVIWNQHKQGCHSQHSTVLKSFTHTNTLAKTPSFSMHDFQNAGTHQSRHAWNKTNESWCNLCLHPVLSPPTPPNPVAIDTWMRFRSWRFPTILVTSTPSGDWFDKFYRHIHQTLCYWGTSMNSLSKKGLFGCFLQI